MLLLARFTGMEMLDEMLVGASQMKTLPDSFLWFFKAHSSLGAFQ